MFFLSSRSCRSRAVNTGSDHFEIQNIASSVLCLSCCASTRVLRLQVEAHRAGIITGRNLRSVRFLGRYRGIPASSILWLIHTSKHGKTITLLLSVYLEDLIYTWVLDSTPLLINFHNIWEEMKSCYTPLAEWCREKHIMNSNRLSEYMHPNKYCKKP